MSAQKSDQNKLANYIFLFKSKKVKILSVKDLKHEPLASTSEVSRTGKTVAIHHNEVRFLETYKKSYIVSNKLYNINMQASDLMPSQNKQGNYLVRVLAQSSISIYIQTW